MDTVSNNLFSPLDEGSIDLLYFFVDLISKEFGGVFISVIFFSFSFHLLFLSLCLSDIVVGRGLRQRLGLPQIPVLPREEMYRIFAFEGQKLSDLYTIPEQDAFRYGEDGHISRVCSCFGIDVCFFILSFSSRFLLLSASSDRWHF
jgi:hypothetical protein